MSNRKHFLRRLNLPPRQNVTSGEDTLTHIANAIQISGAGVLNRPTNYKCVVASFCLIPGRVQLPDPIS
jgi:hypothetical protein